MRFMEIARKYFERLEWGVCFRQSRGFPILLAEFETAVLFSLIFFGKFLLFRT